MRLEGFLAYDEPADEAVAKRPGILVVHEWWGLNDYARCRARQLAELRDVAFALDMYGAGKSTERTEQASEWSGALSTDRQRLRARAAAGLAVVREQLMVDPDRVAAIGYCFGGATVIELAYSGADLDGVVSFHGNPRPALEEDLGRIRACILVCHGAADPLVKPEAMATFTDSLKSAGVDWQVLSYGGAVHSFTNPGSDRHGIAGVGYDEAADRRSWQHMRLFFDELFDE